MTSRQRLTLLVAFTLALPLPPLASAAEETKTRMLSLEFSAGAEYDSNVAVLDLDTSSGESDVAALIDFGIGLHKDLTKRLKLDLGYNFSQSLHDEFSQFDIRIHRGSAGIEYDLGGVSAGATFQYADAALDGDEYLVLEQASPYLSKLFGKRLFVRLAWARTDKEFMGAPERDATSEAPSIDLFVFANGAKRYVVFGYQYQDEDALDDQFDYTGSKLKLQFSGRSTRGSRQTAFKAGVRYESRDYPTPMLPIFPQRSDERYRAEAEVEVSVSKYGFLRVRYEYADNRSNQASVNFDEHVASLVFGAKL